MLRLTRKVFVDLAIWMISLGLMMGVVFPFFAMLMGVPAGFVLTPLFFISCISAGVIVAGANIWLARRIVGKRLRMLADRMRLVEGNLRQMSRSQEAGKCTPEACSITVDSEDELGESARAFNYLVEALAS